MIPKTASPSKRRLWKRHQVSQQVTILVRKPRLIELGPLVDISMGGLAFQYIESEERVFEGEELAISVAGEGVKLGPVSFKTCLELNVACTPDGKKIKKRCVAFKNLTTYQNFQLKSFIENHALEHKKDRRAGNDRRQYDDPRFDNDDYRMMYDLRLEIDRRDFR